MKWRVMLELVGPDGTVVVHEVSGRAAVGEYVPRAVGLTLADGKHRSRGCSRPFRLRRRNIAATGGAVSGVERNGRSRICAHRRLLSLFGTVEVRAPRFTPCRCAVTCRGSSTRSPRSCPTDARPNTSASSRRWVSLLPYRRARTLLSEFLPLAMSQRWRRPASEHCVWAPGWSRRRWRGSPRQRRRRRIHRTVHRRRPRAVGSAVIRFARSRLCSRRSATMTGSRSCSPACPRRRLAQLRQLRGVLHGLGATPATPITILSDGADGPRSLGEAASSVQLIMCWTGFISRCGSSMLPRRPRAGPTRQTAIARLAPALPNDRADPLAPLAWSGQAALSISLAKPCVAVEAMADAASPAAAAARRWRAFWAISRHMYPDNPISSSTTRQPADAKNRSRRRSPRARCNGCCIGE